MVDQALSQTMVGPRFFLLTIRYYLRGRFKIGRKARREVARVLLSDMISNRSVAPLAIDCGANVGRISERLLKNGFILHAFEPDPVAGEALQSRLSGNPDLHFHAKAVGLEPGSALLYRHKEFDGDPDGHTESSSLINQRKCDDKNVVEVEVIDFPAFLDGLDQQVGLLKLDIEGFETEILHALIDRGLMQKIDYVFAETHERFNFPLAWRTAQLRAKVHMQGIGNINLDHG